ncbi:MAG: hypothetical protein ACJ71N_08500 [Terriglobales bacterium]|jgi:hypothetical protein
MKRTTWLLAVTLCSLLALFPRQAAAQAANQSDVAVIISQVSQASSDAQRDVAHLRIDKWKMEGDERRRAEARAESISRNLTAALPGMLDAVRVAPNSLAATFKLYRNLSALSDPLAALTDDAANGSKEEHNALALDAENLERARLALGDRLERITANADADLAKLRAGAKPQTAAGPKKIVIDDSAPAPKKPRKKTTP